jgi:hypothetical protein
MFTTNFVAVFEKRACFLTRSLSVRTCIPLYLKDVVALSSHSLFFPPTIYENADRACVPFSSFIVYGPQQGLFCSVFHHFLPCVFHSLNKSIGRTKSPRRLSFYFSTPAFLGSSAFIFAPAHHKRSAADVLLVVTGADFERVLYTKLLLAFASSSVEALEIV